MEDGSAHKKPALQKNTSSTSRPVSQKNTSYPSRPGSSASFANGNFFPAKVPVTTSVMPYLVQFGQQRTAQKIEEARALNKSPQFIHSHARSVLRISECNGFVVLNECVGPGNKQFPVHVPPKNHPIRVRETTETKFSKALEFGQFQTFQNIREGLHGGEPS